MIRIGVLGVGYWGPNLVRTLNEIENVEVVAVVDPSSGRREFIRKRFPSIRTVADPENVLFDPTIDALFLATPPETHSSLALASVAAGKHVFIEKPLALHKLDADRVCSAAQACKRVLSVGHLYLYHPAIICLKSMIQSGDLGEVYYASSTRANVGPPHSSTNVLWDLAPHDISIILDLFGEMPSVVSARGAAFTQHNYLETACVNLSFASGRMAQVNVSWLTPKKTRQLTVICSRKTAVFDDMETQRKVEVFEAGSDTRGEGAASDARTLMYSHGSIWSPSIDSDQPLRRECKDFIRCIEQKQTPRSSGQSAVDVVHVIECAGLSIRRNAPITL